MKLNFSDEHSEFLPILNFAILCYSRNSQKSDACENYCFTVHHRL